MAFSSWKYTREEKENLTTQLTKLRTDGLEPTLFHELVIDVALTFSEMAGAFGVAMLSSAIRFGHKALMTKFMMKKPVSALKDKEKQREKWKTGERIGKCVAAVGLVSGLAVQWAIHLVLTKHGAQELFSSLLISLLVTICVAPVVRCVFVAIVLQHARTSEALDGLLTLDPKLMFFHRAGSGTDRRLQARNFLELTNLGITDYEESRQAASSGFDSEDALAMHYSGRLTEVEVELGRLALSVQALAAQASEANRVEANRVEANRVKAKVVCGSFE
jgi:hypothetical protein